MQRTVFQSIPKRILARATSCFGNFVCLLLVLIATSAAQAEDPPPVPLDLSFNPRSAFEKERKHFPHIELVEPRMPESVVGITNLVYSVLKDTAYGDRALHLDVFRPQESKVSAYPAVVMIHGGGWRSGSRSHLVPMAQQLAALGYVCVTLEYRLALEANYPASVQDIRTAIRWLRQHAADYTINADKIAVLGCSSGAHLATLIGVTSDEKSSVDVQAIINIDGVVSFIHPEAEAEIQGDAASTWLGVRYEENPVLWTDTSPLEHVGPRTPPILFVNSSIPRFHAGRDDFIAKLDGYGIHSEVHTFENSPHPFWLFHPWFEPTVLHVQSFLGTVFTQKEQL